MTEPLAVICPQVFCGLGAVVIVVTKIRDRRARLRRKRSGRIFTVTVEAPFENTVEYARMTADEAAVVLERVHAARAATQVEEMRELAGQSKGSQTM
jgi:hypothetical protein